jgi:GT2 family glycosyltransferase
LKLSLIMGTVDRVQDIHAFLDALERQTMPDAELVIVDQNPAGRLDSVVGRLARSGRRFTHLRCEQRSLSYARNVGFPAATGELIGYPDDDCWYEPEVVAGVLDAFARHPRLGGVIARWCELDDGSAPEHDLSLERWRQFRVEVSAFSSCIFVRREVIEAIGGFDERLGVPLWFSSAEEVDLVMRAMERGYQFRYMPDLRVHHPEKPYTEGPLAPMLRRERSRARGIGATYRKHRLSWLVIARGLAAPLVTLAAPPYTLRKVLVNAMNTLGRLEGWLAWREAPRRS